MVPAISTIDVSEKYVALKDNPYEETNNTELLNVEEVYTKGEENKKVVCLRFESRRLNWR